ncbi:MAG: M56 family metallopeptidase [Chloroflexi bacterium]|nr:M56 family metallopeptidase [Chloroflexota bacterium]
MADRSFRQILLLAVLTSVPLATALALTLFPGSVQRALHGSDALVPACLAALYGIGQRLPPIGVPTLALALAAVLTAGARALALTVRTRALTESCVPVALPPGLTTMAERVGIRGRLTVFDSAAPLAFTAGLVRPCVYVSTATVSTLEADELEAVLLHERAHLRRREPSRIALARLIASALFFVPLAEDLRRRFETAKELDADREVLAAQRSVAPLAGAIDRLGADRALPADRLAVGAWSCAEARIDQLEGVELKALLPATPARATWLSALALGALLALALGQAVRANVVPAAAWELSGGPMSASVHVCPLPLEGPLF